jgi:hypothetical protein
MFLLVTLIFAMMVGGGYYVSHYEEISRAATLFISHPNYDWLKAKLVTKKPATP